MNIKKIRHKIREDRKEKWQQAISQKFKTFKLKIPEIYAKKYTKRKELPTSKCFLFSIKNSREKEGYILNKGKRKGKIN